MSRARPLLVYCGFAVIAVVIALLTATVATMIGALVLASGAGPFPHTLAELNDRLRPLLEPTTTTGLILGLVPTAVSFAGVSFLFARSLAGSVHDPVPLRAAPWRDYLLVPIGMVAWSTALGSVIGLLGFGDEGTIAALREAFLSRSLLERAALLPASALFPGFAEELFFRGLVLGVGRAWVGARAGWIVSAVLFGLVHLDPVHSPIAALIGVFLGFARLRGTSLWPLILAHVANNTLATLWPDFGSGSDAAQIALLVGSVLLGIGCTILLARKPPDQPLTQTPTIVL